MAGRHWSTSEDNTLKLRFPQEGTSPALQQDLNRSFQSVEKRARDLDIKKYYRRYVRWTTEEDELIRLEYPSGDCVGLMKKMRRSRSAVSARANRLGVSVSKEIRSFISHKQGRGKDNVKFRGCGRISVAYVCRLKTRKKWICTITPQYLESIATEICPISGRTITYRQFTSEVGATASVDRIDSTKGYIEGNVRWIHKDVNRARRNMEDKEFFLWVKNIATFYGTPIRFVAESPPSECVIKEASKKGSWKYTKGKDGVAFKGYGRVFGSYIAALRCGAKDRHIACPLFGDSHEAAKYLNEIITDVCPLSGKSLTFPEHSLDRTSTASLDRIDSSKGYEKGNVRWTHKIVNWMKWELSDEAFVSLIRDIVKHLSL